MEPSLCNRYICYKVFISTISPSCMCNFQNSGMVCSKKWEWLMQRTARFCSFFLVFLCNLLVLPHTSIPYTILNSFWCKIYLIPSAELMILWFWMTKPMWHFQYKHSSIITPRNLMVFFFPFLVFQLLISIYCNVLFIVKKDKFGFCQYLELTD